jgi:hypothetical protein
MGFNWPPQPRPLQAPCSLVRASRCLRGACSWIGPIQAGRPGLAGSGLGEAVPFVPRIPRVPSNPLSSRLTFQFSANPAASPSRCADCSANVLLHSETPFSEKSGYLWFLFCGALSLHLAVCTSSQDRSPAVMQFSIMYCRSTVRVRWRLPAIIACAKLLGTGRLDPVYEKP